MDKMWQDIILSQFNAAMNMFDDALLNCPDHLWQGSMWNDPDMPGGFSQFWYVAYHTLFWLDFYLTGRVEGFAPPAPFTLAELDPQGVLPDRVYNRQELQAYLAYCRLKCRETIQQLTDGEANRLCAFKWMKDRINFAELLLDNLRHVQEHAAQLHMYLGQQAGITSRWVEHTKADLPDR